MVHSQGLEEKRRAVSSSWGWLPFGDSGDGHVSQPEPSSARRASSITSSAFPASPCLSGYGAPYPRWIPLEADILPSLTNRSGVGAKSLATDFNLLSPFSLSHTSPSPLEQLPGIAGEGLPSTLTQWRRTWEGGGGFNLPPWEMYFLRLGQASVMLKRVFLVLFVHRAEKALHIC